MQGIPQQTLDVSNEIELPIIEIPAEIPYTDITRPIMELILDRQAALLRRSEEVYRTLTAMVLENSGIQAVSDSVSGLLRAPVKVVDTEGKTIVSSPADLYWGEADSPLQWGITVDRRQVAKLLVAKDRLDEMEKVCIEQARIVLALEIMRGKIVADTEHRLRGNFIDELLTPPVPSRHEVEQRGRKLGMHVEHLWEVAVIEGDQAPAEEALLKRLGEEARLRRVSPHVEFRSNRAVLFLPSMDVKRAEDCATCRSHGRILCSNGLAIKRWGQRAAWLGLEAKNICGRFTTAIPKRAKRWPSPAACPGKRRSSATKRWRSIICWERRCKDRFQPAV
ncbi:hypothetical protein HMSSN036_86170 [Paenibacillus macerans]|nr:hypothetical protein HMSSN036_86170 [Paenibacillus macerans]